MTTTSWQLVGPYSEEKNMNSSKNGSNNAKWTVMVYMAADNNLTEECVFALKEMQRIGTAPGVKAVALYDSSAQNVPTRVYTFKEKAADTCECADDGHLARLGVPFFVKARRGRGTTEIHTASHPKVLEEFVRTSLREHPAENYLLVFSGHGQGAVGDFLKGDDPPRSLSIPDMAAALTRAVKGKGKIGVLGMDTCLMGMAEVAYELRNIVQFMVSAEGFEINTGWPYQRIMEELNKSVAGSGLTPEEMARTILERYMSYYRDYVIAGVSVDQAVCDLSKAEKLAAAVKDLATALKRGVPNSHIQNAIVLAHWKAQTFCDDKYVDLWDFCHLLEEGCEDVDVQLACRNLSADVKGACQKVKAAIENFVVTSSYSGAAFQHSHGVSVYFPWRRNAEELKQYKNLEFHGKTKWGDFLDAYVKETKREIRGAGQYSMEHAVCVRPGNNTVFVTRAVAPWTRGEGQLTGSMKNPPLCFFQPDAEKQNR
jgi:hypothetical protein